MTEPEQTFNAVVTDIRLESRIDGVARWQVALDNTWFSVELAEGLLVAISPGGTRLEVPLLGVVEDESTIWHVIGKPLATGTEVTGQVGLTA